MPENKYTMKMVTNGSTNTPTTFRKDSYAMQYAMQNNGGEDSKSGEPLKLSLIHI